MLSPAGWVFLTGDKLSNPGQYQSEWLQSAISCLDERFGKAWDLGVADSHSETDITALFCHAPKSWWSLGNRKRFTQLYWTCMHQFWTTLTDDVAGRTVYSHTGLSSRRPDRILLEAVKHHHSFEPVCKPNQTPHCSWANLPAHSGVMGSWLAPSTVLFYIQPMVLPLQ